MRTDREKIIKASLAAPIGLIVSHLLGYTDVITVSVTMLLVCVYGSANSKRAAAFYSGRRILAQLVTGAFAAAAVLILRQWEALPQWLVAVVASAVTMPAVLLLDYRFHFASAYLLTASVGLLVMINGMLQKDTYPIRRFFLVSVGCVMGLALNCVFSLRSRRQSRRDISALVQLQGRLLEQMFGVPGEGCAQTLLGQYKKLREGLTKDTEILLQDAERSNRRAELERFHAFCKLQAYFVSAAESILELKPQEHWEKFCQELTNLSGAALKLLQVDAEWEGGRAPSAAMPDTSRLSDCELVAAGSVIAYRLRLEQALDAFLPAALEKA